MGGTGQLAGGVGGAGGSGGDIAPNRRRRRTDRWRPLNAAALILAAASILLSAWLYARIVSEGRERRDQSCLQNERRHLDDVQQLRNTYEFLEHLPRSEWGTPLTRAIVRQLPQIERDARVDVAPKFCDEHGIGLPEPDPVVPKRRNFDRLLHRP